MVVFPPTCTAGILVVYSFNRRVRANSRGMGDPPYNRRVRANSLGTGGTPYNRQERATSLGTKQISSGIGPYGLERKGPITDLIRNISTRCLSLNNEYNALMDTIG